MAKSKKSQIMKFICPTEQTTLWELIFSYSHNAFKSFLYVVKTHGYVITGRGKKITFGMLTETSNSMHSANFLFLAEVLNAKYDQNIFSLQYSIPFYVSLLINIPS